MGNLSLTNSATNWDLYGTFVVTLAELLRLINCRFIIIIIIIIIMLHSRRPDFLEVAYRLQGAAEGL